MSELIILSDLRELIKLVYKTPFPKSEEYGLKSQTRRAIVSVSLNIREGNSFIGKNKLRFFNIAKGSLNEVDECFIISETLGYINNSEFLAFREQYWLCLNKLNKLIKSITREPSEMR